VTSRTKKLAQYCEISSVFNWLHDERALVQYCNAAYQYSAKLSPKDADQALFQRSTDMLPEMEYCPSIVGCRFISAHLVIDDLCVIKACHGAWEKAS
jgi:hypothetical protein